MIKKAFLALLIGFIGLGIYLYVYLGGYKDVEISTGEYPALHLVFVKHMGAYHHIGPRISQVEAWALQESIPCPRTFGEYLDDPAAVDQDRLRSQGGCVLESAPPKTLPEGFVYEMRPAARYVIARFDGAPSVGPMKVYPKVYEYMQTQRLKAAGPTLELYSIRGKSVQTEYLFPLAL